jgi:hypothetical protein
MIIYWIDNRYLIIALILLGRGNIGLGVGQNPRMGKAALRRLSPRSSVFGQFDI